MMMLLPLLLSKNGSGNADITNLLLQAFSSGSNGQKQGGQGTAAQNTGKNAFLPLLMAMMMGKNTSKRSPNDGKENVPPDVGGIFGQDVRNVLDLFIAMNGKRED